MASPSDGPIKRFIGEIHRRSLWQVLGVTVKRVEALGVLLILVWPGWDVQAQESPAALSQVEDATQTFFDAAHAFDYAAMRAGATPDFEMLYSGRRMTLDDFVEMLRGMEEARGGRAIPTYDAQGLNTEVVGEAAYTTWLSENGRWFESMILVWSGDRWLVDRAFTMRTTNENP
jgi:hypothetical protein